MITDFVILTFEPITQFFPMTDLEIKHFSPILVPSPIKVSAGLSQRVSNEGRILIKFYFLSVDSFSLLFVEKRQFGRAGGFKKESKFPWMYSLITLILLQ